MSDLNLHREAWTISFHLGLTQIAWHSRTAALSRMSTLQGSFEV